MIYKRKRTGGSRSPTWSYDFVHNGRRHKGSTGLRDKALARKFEDQLKAEARLGRPLDPADSPAPPRFRDYAEAYHKGDGALKRSASDDRSILDRALLPYFGRLHLDDELVGHEFAARPVAEDTVRRLAKANHNLRGAARHALARAEVERHAAESPVIDQ